MAEEDDAGPPGSGAAAGADWGPEEPTAQANQADRRAAAVQAAQIVGAVATGGLPGAQALALEAARLARAAGVRAEVSGLVPAGDSEPVVPPPVPRPGPAGGRNV